MPFLRLKIVFAGKDIIGGGEGYQLREESASYSALLGPKKPVISSFLILKAKVVLSAI